MFPASSKALWWNPSFGFVYSCSTVPHSQRRLIWSFPSLFHRTGSPDYQLFLSNICDSLPQDEMQTFGFYSRLLFFSPNSRKCFFSCLWNIWTDGLRAISGYIDPSFAWLTAILLPLIPLCLETYSHSSARSLMRLFRHICHPLRLPLL